MKANAIPTIFPGLLAYLSSKIETSQLSSTSSSAHLSNENPRIEEGNNSIMLQDMVETYFAFSTKIKDEMLPNGYLLVIKDHRVQFHYVDSSAGENSAPSLLVSMVVIEQLNIKAFVHSTLFPFSQYAHLLPDDSLKRISEILNILAFCKSCAYKSVEKSAKQLLDTALLLLDNCIEVVKNSENDDLLHLPLLIFVNEQLKLMHVPKQHQHQCQLNFAL